MNKQFLIFVDDERENMFEIVKKNFPNFNHYHCKNYKKAIQKIKEVQAIGEIFLDLDHDLGTGKSGYDVALYVVENHIPLIGFKCHSMNPVGRKNIEQLLTHYGYSLQ